MTFHPLSLTGLPSFIWAETHMAEISLQYREEAAAGGPSAWWFLLIPLAAAAIAGVANWYSNRPPVIVDTPLGMMYELCKAHHVGTRGRQLLQRIAETNQLEQPSLLFVSLERFNALVDAAGQKRRYNKRQRSTLGLLRRQLFAASA